MAAVIQARSEQDSPGLMPFSAYAFSSVKPLYSASSLHLVRIFQAGVDKS